MAILEIEVTNLIEKFKAVFECFDHLFTLFTPNLCFYIFWEQVWDVLAIVVNFLGQKPLGLIFTLLHQQSHYGFWNHVIHCFSDRIKIAYYEVFDDCGLHFTSWRALPWIRDFGSLEFDHVRHVNGFYLFHHIRGDLVILVGGWSPVEAAFGLLILGLFVVLLL